MSNFKKTARAFTLIELMVSIFLTLTVLGTFYKLYKNYMKSERALTIRASANLFGEQLADTIANSMKLIGLNNVYDDYTTGGNPSSRVILKKFSALHGEADAAAGKSQIEFSYVSPFGGPITKLYKKAGGSFPTCNFTIYNTASLDNGVRRLYLMSKKGVFSTVENENFYGGVDVAEGGKGLSFSATIQGDGSGSSCEELFPAGTLVSGNNFEFTLKYTPPFGVDGASELKLTATKPNESSVKETFVNFSSKDSPYDIPRFVLQFLIEGDEAIGSQRVWKTTKHFENTPSDILKIKAVRFGFVVVSKSQRVAASYKPSGAASTNSTTYCIFDDADANCYEHTNPNETVYVFRRAIHLKNYDYLGRNNG